MMDDDLRGFLGGKEAVPSDVLGRVLELSLHSMNPKPLLLKFYASNLLGGILTLYICPQYGFGGMNGFFRNFMAFGPIWCGVFCSGVFFIGANTASLFIMTQSELRWIARKNLSVMAPWIGLLLFFGMVAKFYAPGHAHHASASHYLSWYVTALVITFSYFSAWKESLRFRARS